MASGLTTVVWLRWVALLEAASYLSLLGAAVAKRALDQPGGVTVLGPAHGLISIAYVGLVLLVRDERGWGSGRTALVIGAAVVPLGGYLVERRLLRGPA